MSVLSVSGSCLQVLGLGAAARGVWQTRKSYAPERLGIIGDSLLAGRHFWHQAVADWRWIERHALRRRHGGTVASASGSASGTLSISGEAFAQITYGELDNSWRIVQKLAKLDCRTRDVRTLLSSLQLEQRTSKRQIGALDERITATRTVLRGEVSAAVRKLATDGLRLQAAGLF
jgi:hypothetical protein